jgi:hypothetical protein
MYILRDICTIVHEQSSHYENGFSPLNLVVDHLHNLIRITTKGLYKYCAASEDRREKLSTSINSDLYTSSA